jgi:hypothetical protein
VTPPTYEQLLREALVDLSEMQEVDAKSVGRKMGSNRQEDHNYFLQHWSSLYLRYVQIARKLAQCHDQILQPQKRQDCRVLLDSTLGRMLEMKQRIVEFCGEYVNLDEVLVDLKLTPEALEIPIPRYFVEDRRSEFENEKRFIQNMLNEQKISPDDFEPKPAAIDKAMPIERAVEIIQSNERGRQGRQKARMYKSLNEQNFNNTDLESHVDKQSAAVQIQRIIRAHLARKRFQQMAREELEFLGMEESEKLTDGHNRRKLATKLRSTERKQKQQANTSQLQDEAKRMRADIKMQEGGRVMEEMLDEVLVHMANLRLLAKEDVLPEFPSEEEGGSLRLLGLMPGQLSPEEEAKKAEEEAAAAAAAAKKGGKEPKKTEKELEEEALPTIQPSMFWSRFDAVRKRYMDTWQQHFQSTYLANKDFEQGLDKELLRTEIMDGPGDVMAELRKCVDQLVMVEVTNLRERMERDRGKKPKKPKSKKPPKKKPVKDPTEGQPLPKHELVLIINGVLQLAREGVKLADYIGAPNMMGSIMDEYERNQALQQDEVRDKWQKLIANWNPYVEQSLRMSKDQFEALFKSYCEQHNWTFEPSMQQVRQAVTEYCVLPLGSQIVHDLAPSFNTVLFYGPPKSGKTLLTHAVCNEAGAHLFSLSPAVVNNPQLNVPLPKLVQATFRVARSMAPSVVYIDEIEKVFMSGKGKKKKKGEAGAGKSAKIKKDLVNQVKKELDNTDRVMVIGNSSAPWLGEFKEMSTFFQRMIFCVHPDYASRLLLWQTRCAQRGAPLRDQDYEVLAYMTNKYSSGTIIQIIDETLTDRRVKRAKTKAVSADEFLPAMSRATPIFKEDYEELRQFADKLPLHLRRVKPEDTKNPDDEDEKGKKGKKKAAKKKA